MGVLLNWRYSVEKISIPEIRTLLQSVEKIAVRPADVTHKDLMLAPALFKKLVEHRTQGVVSIQVLIDGKPVEIEVTE